MVFVETLVISIKVLLSYIILNEHACVYKKNVITRSIKFSIQNEILSFPYTCIILSERICVYKKNVTAGSTKFSLPSEILCNLVIYYSNVNSMLRIP